MIFKEEDMQAQTPRKESTMARRFLEIPQTSSQKGKNRHSSPTCRQYSSSSPSLSSPLRQSLPSLPHTYTTYPHTRTLIELAFFTLMYASSTLGYTQASYLFQLGQVLPTLG